jgi:hypothetical protein
VVDGGYVLHDYLDYNPSRADVLRRREHDRLRKESARNPNGIQAVSAKFPRAPSPTPSPTPLGSTQVADREQRNDHSAAVIAEVLAAAAFVSSDLSDVERLVERSLELVPAFDARAGPREAELFARFRWRTPPRDWYRAWIYWIKRAADQAGQAGAEDRAAQRDRHLATGVFDPGRYQPKGRFAAADAAHEPQTE